MPIYSDYKYDAALRYLSLQKLGKKPLWGYDAIFLNYSENMNKLTKNERTLASSASMRQHLKNLACKFEMSKDGKTLMKDDKPVLREGEYDEVLSRFHDMADHPGMIITRGKILAHYACVSYERVDSYVRNCEVCKAKNAPPVKKDHKPRRKRKLTIKSPSTRGTSSPSITHVKAQASPLQCYALRLHPGNEIKSSLQKFVKTNNLNSAFILSCVGSVRRCTLRLADSESILEICTDHEIVSLVGTLSAGGHIHASLADDNGQVIGGHVMGNMEVFTTAEIVIGNMPSFRFKREMDSKTSFKELEIESTETNQTRHDCADEQGRSESLKTTKTPNDGAKKDHAVKDASSTSNSDKASRKASSDASNVLSQEFINDLVAL